MMLGGSADLREPFSGKSLRGTPRERIGNSQQSLFRVALARGMSASAAYVEAGYKASTTDALG